MSKSKKYFLIAAIVLGVGYLLTIKPDGSFLKPIANLIMDKSEDGGDNWKHTLDLQKYRPSRLDEK